VRQNLKPPNQRETVEQGKLPSKGKKGKKRKAESESNSMEENDGAIEETAETGIQEEGAVMQPIDSVESIGLETAESGIQEEGAVMQPIDSVESSGLMRFAAKEKTFSANAMLNLQDAAKSLEGVVNLLDGNQQAAAFGHFAADQFASNLTQMAEFVKNKVLVMACRSGEDFQLDEEGRRPDCKYVQGVKKACVGCLWKLPYHKINNTCSNYCETCLHQFQVHLYFCGSCITRYSHYPNLVLDERRPGYVNGGTLRDYINKRRMSSFAGPIPHWAFRQLPHCLNMEVKGEEEEADRLKHAAEQHALMNPSTEKL
jgi:hypothetical protein